MRYESMRDRMLVNLSFVSRKPTGLSTYALNVFPYLQHLQPVLLSPEAIASHTCKLVPQGMTPDVGSKGHLKRLLWTQGALSRIYHQLGAPLLFSPIPEAPLFVGCRTVVTVHDLIPLRFGMRFSRLTTYFRHYVPAVLRQARHILCNSQSTARELTNYFGIPQSKMTPILLGYDAERFRFLDLPVGNYFVYLGRPDRHKNLHRLLAAFAQLPVSLDCELWLVGGEDPRYTPGLKALAEELQITPRVRFLDYVPYDRLVTILNQAIALVFPSLWEGFGLPALEAMACGTPVITSHLSALPEVVGDAGLQIDPYNVGAIANAMLEVAQDGQLRRQLQRAGLARAQQFSWEATGKATAAVLSQFV